MKIIVLHGEDTIKSYERLKKFIETAKSRSWEILYDEISLTPSLFGVDRLTVIRDYKLINKKVLAKAAGTLVIYHESVLPKTFLNILPKDAKIEEFKLPKKLWYFLDHINLKNFHDILKTEPVEFIFIMIAWKLKKRYIAKPDKKIAGLIQKLAKIDYDAKTGRVDLTVALDLFIVKHLE